MLTILPVNSISGGTDVIDVLVVVMFEINDERFKFCRLASIEPKFIPVDIDIVYEVYMDFYNVIF